LDLIKEIITSVQEVIKFFKRHHIENACLERLQFEKIGKTIKFNLPVITRWGSHHTCLQSFLASKKALQVNLYIIFKKFKKLKIIYLLYIYIIECCF